MPSKRAFPILSIAIPLLLRAISEIIMGPYVVGFDTSGHYIPFVTLWLNGAVDPVRFIASGPLFYSLVSVFAISGAPLVLVLKTVPVVLHGLLGFSIYLFAKRGLKWSPAKSTLTALLGTAYFVALRISWDMLREEMALILFFAALTVFAVGESSKFSWKHVVLLSAAMLGVVMTQQLVSVIMLGVFAFTAIWKLRRRQFVAASRLVLSALPSLLFFFAIFFLSPANPEFRLIFGVPSIAGDGWLQLFSYASYQTMLAAETGFFFYCFLPLLPLVILSLRRFDNFQMHSWLLMVLILSMIPIASPSNLRWTMLLVYPFAFYAVEGLSRIKPISWRRFKSLALKVAVVYLVASTAVLSLGFILWPPESPFPYFNYSTYNVFIYQIPSSMLQNTVSITDCADTANALRWFKTNVDSSAVLLTHRAFYGWALSTVNPSQVVLYEYDDPIVAAESAARGGISQVYLVWWVNGQGWYGQPTVSSDFQPVCQIGKIAIYNYTLAGRS